MTIQKAATGLLSCAMIFTMTACQTRSSAPTTVPTLPEQTQNTLSAVQLQGSEELKTILDGIEENVFPGTAGSSLTAVPYTVQLLDWCKSAGISESELRGVIAQWLQGKDQGEIAHQFELISETYDLLMSDRAEALLDTAGCQTDSYPWPESCRQVMKTILESTGADMQTTAQESVALVDALNALRDSDSQEDLLLSSAALLNWAAATSDTQEGIRATVVEWMANQGNDVQVQFAENLKKAADICQSMVSGEKTQELTALGITGTGWTEMAMQEIDPILEAAGVQE